MDHSSIQFILPILKYLNAIKPQFDTILKVNFNHKGTLKKEKVIK